MKKNKASCCSACFGRIAAIDVGAAKFWLNACELTNSDNMILRMKPIEHFEYDLLEKLGFISTIDTLSEIVIKLNGLKKDNEGHYFCGGKCA